MRNMFGGRKKAARGDKVLILTPVKDAKGLVEDYCERVRSLEHPHDSISFGFLESDSSDGTYEELLQCLPRMRKEFPRVAIEQRNFGYKVPIGVHRAADHIQGARRAVLAKSRNYLLFRTLQDEDWVLWLDVDVVEYPADIIARLIATGKDIVQPHCVLEYGGPTYDRNGWRDHGQFHLDDLRGTGDLVELDTVGGTMLLVRADVHREGLIFPPFPYGRENSKIRPGHEELETEGLGIMAQDMGYQCWGMPNLEIRHGRW
jgi:hypothetical protein